jgi:hypothetical protein
MNTTPRLVVDYGNFIIVDDKGPSLLHNSFGGFNDNPMHAFNHLPGSEIKPMFTWSEFFTFKVPKNSFMLSKFVKGHPNFKS